MFEHIQRNLFSNCFDNPRTFWAWTNNAHVSHKHIPELRQLVKARLPQQAADRCNSWIISRSEKVRVSRMIGTHGPKFQHEEWFTIETHSFLLIKDWPG